MNFDEYIKARKVIKGKPDTEKAKAILKMSEQEMKASKILTESTPGVMLCTAYNSLRQVLESICLKEGLKVYSHEAFTAYLVSKGENNLAEKFDRYRKLRNKIQYYGYEISPATAKRSRDNIEKLRLLILNR